MFFGKNALLPYVAIYIYVGFHLCLTPDIYLIILKFQNTNISVSDFKGIEIIQFEFVTKAQLISVLSILMYIYFRIDKTRRSVFQHIFL